MEQALYCDPTVSDYRVKNVAMPKVRYVEERVGRKGRWLDIGCGTGEILAAARERGWTVQGIETNERAAKIGMERFGVPIATRSVGEAGALEDLDAFDVVSMFGVLEHFYEPKRLIDSVTRNMPSGGALVIEVPHYPSISCFSQMAFPNFVDRMLSPPMHLMIFTLRALENLLRRHGLEITHVWYYGQDFYEWLSTVSSVCPLVENRRLFEALLGLNGEFQEVIDRHYLSDEMMVIAREC
jgi:2-polyprenyl-3-methyl-5-hydroxy-6-metoxy-1,4-benzoquinol methylase